MSFEIVINNNREKRKKQRKYFKKVRASLNKLEQVRPS
jgi:phage anti-repressor protein